MLFSGDSALLKDEPQIAPFRKSLFREKGFFGQNAPMMGGIEVAFSCVRSGIKKVKAVEREPADMGQVAEVITRAEFWNAEGNRPSRDEQTPAFIKKGNRVVDGDMLENVHCSDFLTGTFDRPRKDTQVKSDVDMGGMLGDFMIDLALHC